MARALAKEAAAFASPWACRASSEKRRAVPAQTVAGAILVAVVVPISKARLVPVPRVLGVVVVLVREKVVTTAGPVPSTVVAVVVEATGGPRLGGADPIREDAKAVGATVAVAVAVVVTATLDARGAPGVVQDSYSDLFAESTAIAVD